MAIQSTRPEEEQLHPPRNYHHTDDILTFPHHLSDPSPPATILTVDELNARSGIGPVGGRGPVVPDEPHPRLVDGDTLKVFGFGSSGRRRYPLDARPSSQQLLMLEGQAKAS